jgi:PqqD family protein of HPr-rel-A system
MSNARLKELAISDSGFVFDPFSGGTFTLNATGQVILRGLKEGKSTDEIVKVLSEEFDQVSPRVEEEVRDFLRTMHEFGLPAEVD